MAYKRISPQPVVEGGTGAQTFTAHGVLIGEGTSAITPLTVGTNGQVLVGSSAADPVFATLTSTSLSYTTGAGSLAINITAPVSIANGGTNATSMTNTDGVVYYDGTRLVTTAVGTATQVLTSNGAGVAPTFQTVGSASITITGDSGGGLTGTSFTFTGGTTGLTFSGAGSTETLGGTLAIANGGTNATTMATSTGIVKYDGTRLVTSSTAKIDSSNRMTNTSQPAFFAYLNTPVTNVTGDGTAYTVAFNATLYDQNSNFNTGTATFTAPVTGIYNFNIAVLAQGIAAIADSNSLSLTVAGTSAATYTHENSKSIASADEQFQGSWTIKMTATDTATVVFTVANTSKNIGVYGAGASDPGRTFMSGYLVC